VNLKDGQRVRLRGVHPISNFGIDVDGRMATVRLVDDNILDLELDDLFEDLKPWDNRLIFDLREPTEARMLEDRVKRIGWVEEFQNTLRCDLCGKTPDVDPSTDVLDLHQMCHVGGEVAPWWCSECAEIPKFGTVPCPEEFLDSEGNCSFCDGAAHG